MKSEGIGTWLSLIANFGVLLGLGLLIIELRHNTLATQAVLNQESVNYQREHAALLIGDENKELAEIVFRGSSDPDSLSPTELTKFNVYVSYEIAAWETTFFNYELGLIPERVWRATDAGFSFHMQNQKGPGYRRWWETTGFTYDRAFQEHVDRVFKETK